MISVREVQVPGWVNNKTIYTYPLYTFLFNSNKVQKDFVTFTILENVHLMFRMYSIFLRTVIESAFWDLLMREGVSFNDVCYGLEHTHSSTTVMKHQTLHGYFCLLVFSGKACRSYQLLNHVNTAGWIHSQDRKNASSGVENVYPGRQPHVGFEHLQSRDIYWTLKCTHHSFWRGVASQ